MSRGDDDRRTPMFWAALVSMPVLSALIVSALILGVGQVSAGDAAESDCDAISSDVISEPCADSEDGQTGPETANESVAGHGAEDAQPAEQEDGAAASHGGSSGLTREGGVYWYNGRKETWYSSRVLYHRDTPNWWLDGEGCWRTAEGYYVISSDDFEYGTLVEISKGTAQVLDCGCASGTIDLYVAW